LIEARGRGEREPVVATEDEVAEPRNRRAEVLVR
jgi:outer membrane protein OmpA-like peptidoglycan-associated protein